MSRYDICLQQHVNTCIENSKKQHETGAKGRGSLVTLLSKDTFSKVADAISQLIKATVAEEVRQAGMTPHKISAAKTSAPSSSDMELMSFVKD